MKNQLKLLKHKNINKIIKNVKTQKVKINKIIKIIKTQKTRKYLFLKMKN